MPSYPVKNSKTGEEKELNMNIANYEQWRKDNPDWDKDWSKGCASSQEVGDWQNKLISRNPDGMTFSKERRKCLVQLSRKFKYGKKEKSICRATNLSWTHDKADEAEETA